MNVLVAPDKFKGTMSAPAVAAAVIRGLRRSRPDVRCTPLPIADGGDGTVDVFCSTGFARTPASARDPLGRWQTAAFAVRGDLAVVELAQAAGLARLPNPAPLRASTEGVGDLLRAAAAAGVSRIVLGLGGSASTDGGAGMLRALGARLLDHHDRELPPGGGALRHLGRVDLTGLAALPSVVIAGDVDSPLLGPAGAAAVFGPQKGASVDDVAVLDDGLTRWADVLSAATGTDHRHTAGAGAAGGVGFAALSALGATMRPGISLVLDLLEFDRHLTGCDLVITGEGALDEQTLRGKAVAGIATRAARRGVPTVAIAGVCRLDPEALRQVHIHAAYALTDLEPDEQRCRDDAERLVEDVAATIDPNVAGSQG
jgi:glycerate kinase